ncbi:MAG: chlorophyll synthesis pathway protein BchC [Chloroflexi bacterium]|jgi:3-hydroxyethyl bacteriochlorophyllide a dehydrogenase|uniref:Chlorophyll synthesis pathway protein BchC n=1 Tax=Candidatus Thermofonsia Clade 3 bacterium TaxID=2364212 RepID=A0A2M8QAB1_9CHLR|nr:chlorophyll synthesis pathway protein BchC [Candidatus Roseilinea sp. NK_OTU-006]PJF46747.1 MAG: chlorophyll synthesis pathway protein BchC [Candidatus Thermofonsia Clade 3 bacterium]RMG63324.1 MAG: chlorophyll synthesis pathway protein BchC [Chloroflexota bacterium]
MKTKAIVIPAAHTVELREVELKPLGADDVLVQTTLTSISAGTERMLLRGVMPHPMLQFPVVPGYETVGQVIEAGANARAWLGKRVYVGGSYGFVGVNPAFGGQSAYIVTPQSHLTDLQSLTDEQGVLLALAATALHGVDVAFGAGQACGGEAAPEVWVLGQGVVGQLAARFAKARGARVTVSDKVPSRLRLAVADVKLLAEDGALKAEDGSAVAALDKTCAILIDATGKMEAIAPRLMNVQKGGRVVLLGYYERIDLPYMPAFLRELTFAVSKEWAPGDLARARDAIAAGQVEVRSLITHRLPADDAPRAFDLAFNDPDCVKITLTWSGAPGH